MKILIIEDNDIKFEMLSELLVGQYGANLHRASSYQSAIESLVAEAFDFAMLDITLPVSDLELSPVGVDFLTFGGQLILRESRRKKVNARFVVVSQFRTFVRENKEVSFAQLKSEIMDEYGELVISLIHFEPSSEEWQHQIIQAIESESLNH